MKNESPQLRFPAQMLINGAWVGGSEGTFTILDPSYGTPIVEVPRAGADDVRAAVNAAAAAQPLWAERAPRDRGEILRRTFELMLERREELAHLMTLEMGKSLGDSRAEVTYAAEFFRWFSEEAVRVGGELRTAPSGANRIMTIRKPVGVALLLTPWNFPAAMAARKIAPALAAGCAVVLKPAEDTPLTALALGQLLTEAGAPAGVVNIVTTDRPAELVDAALADGRIRALSFTGSTRVGHRLLTQTAAQVINSSMELGGNGPFIVLDDADLDEAVSGAMVAKMRNGGQACTAANRFLVAQSVVEPFTRKLTEAMSALQIGAGADESTQLGPMINARAVATIADKVDRSVVAGAQIALGGRIPHRDGFFYPATVLTNVPRDSAVATEEIFGPVAPIITVTDDDDAINVANDTDFGLTSYIYGSLARALRVAERLEVGMVGINRGLVSDPAAPFGGVKQSGLGREGGFEGIEEYLETTYIATNW